MKILVALDFGEPSLEALRQGRALAHEFGGTLAVCHVLPIVPDLAAIFSGGSIGRPGETTAEDSRTREALGEYARGKIGLELTEVFVERGTPYAEIVRRADLWRADFVVIGSHGRTGLARAVLGSVAERVARHAHCSVLVARPSSGNPVVLVATDLSDPSLPAIEAGAAAAKRSGSRLVVASALEWSNPASNSVVGLVGALPALPTAELQEQMRDATRSTIERAMAQVGAVGEARVLDGSPVSALVSCAEDLRARLLIVGSRGRTGLARLALGSVAESVIRSAPCSVLAVRHEPGF